MLLPQWFSLSRAPKGQRAARLQVVHHVFSTLELLMAQRDVMQCAQAHGRHVLLASQTKQPAYLTHASARQALIFGIFSFNRFALRAGRQALVYAQKGTNAQAEAIAKGHVGCAHYFGARLKEAEKLLRAAVAVLDRRGDSWERMYFYHNLRHLYSIIGDNENEIACARVEMQIGEAVNDPEGTCWGAYGIANALARSGKHDDAHRYMQRALGILSERSNIVVIPTALQTYGFVHMQSGDYEAARECLEDSCRSIGKDWAFVEYAIRAYPLLVESLLGPKWFDPKLQPDETTVRRSWKLSRLARFWAWRFPNYMPHALRVRGRVAWVLGKHKKAIDCFQRSIQNAESIGARYDVARSCYDLSRTDVRDGHEYEHRAGEVLESLNAVLPVAESDS
jgi:tetratricopeptide (TPR) repeat protein